MPLKTRDLFVDITNRRFVKSFTVNLDASLAPFYQGDTEQIRLHLLEPTGTISTPFRYVNYSASTIKLAIGKVGAGPTGGVFTLTFGANASAELPYSATALQVQSALNAMASVTSAGGVTVSGPLGGPWQITFTNTGARSLFVGDSDALSPLSQIVVSNSQIGTGALRSIQTVKLSRNPAAYQNTFADFDPAAALIVNVVSGDSTHNAVQTLQLSPVPLDGQFTLTFGGQTTGLIDFSASAATVQAALEALSSIGADNVAVTGAAPEWTISFVGTLGNAAQSLVVGNAGTLVVPVGKVGVLGLDGDGVEALIGAATSVDAVIELEITPADTGKPFTAVRKPVTVYNDMIEGAPTIPTPRDSFYTKAEADARFQSAAQSKVIVTQESDKYSLTTADVQLRSLVYVTASDTYYEVVDTTQLNNASGYVALNIDGTLDVRLQVLRGEEADVAQVVLRVGELASSTDTHRVFSGDGVTPGGFAQKQLVDHGPMMFDGAIEIVFDEHRGGSFNSSISATTTGGNFAVLWWDGVVTQHASGVTATYACAEPAGYFPRRAVIFCADATRQLVMVQSASRLGSLRVGRCPALTSIQFNQFMGDTLDLRGAIALTSLEIRMGYVYNETTGFNTAAPRLEYLEGLPATLTTLKFDSAALRYADLNRRGATSVVSTEIQGGPNSFRVPLRSFSPSMMHLDITRFASGVVKTTDIPLSVTWLRTDVVTLDIQDALDYLTALDTLTIGSPVRRQSPVGSTGSARYVWGAGASFTWSHPTLTHLAFSAWIGDPVDLVGLNVAGMPNLIEIRNLEFLRFWSDATLCNAFFNALPMRTSGSPGYIPYSMTGPAGDAGLASARNWNVAFEV